MKTWKTKDGKYIDVKDMETSHIENCIRMLERKLISKPEQYYMGDSDCAEQAVENENKHNEEIATNIERMIHFFRAEIIYREAGKPVGEKPFSTGVIESWEIPYNENAEWWD